MARILTPPAAEPDPAPTGIAAGQIRLRTLTLIRWAAVVGQATTLVVVHYGLGFDLPLGWALLAVGCSAALNLVVGLGRSLAARIPERGAAGLLAFDTVQLAALLFLTGGLANPFAFLLLAPVTVSATILSLRSTAVLCGLALLCTSTLAVWHLPLPWAGAPFAPPTIYVVGSWVALSLGIGFFAAYTWRVAAEARRMSNALAATQLALSREQRLSALGGLAAAAAHELGTPLGTIAVVARELQRELPPDSPHAEEVATLIEQSQRCRAILAELSRRPEGAGGSPYERVPIDALAEAAAAPHQGERVRVRFEAGPAAESDDPAAPMTQHSPEIVHGLGTLIQNAIQFARAEVLVETVWSDREVSVTIADDGPGFSPWLLERLGEPYMSGRGEAAEEHMGLGVFIAQTLLQRTGARIFFANGAAGGARVTVRWTRAALEATIAPPAKADAEETKGTEP